MTEGIFGEFGPKICNHPLANKILEEDEDIQDIFLRRTVSEGHRNSNGSINKPSDQNKLKTNSSSKGQAHGASQHSSLLNAMNLSISNQ